MMNIDLCQNLSKSACGYLSCYVSCCKVSKHVTVDLYCICYFKYCQTFSGCNININLNTFNFRISSDDNRHVHHQCLGDRTWHTLQRRHLHPHYSVSILDDTINRQNDGLQAAINRAIAGAFMGVGETAVASNIVSLTHRIQFWDFRKFVIPDITDGKF